MKPRILIFEDENAIAENLKYALKSEGFHCEHVSTAQAGLDAFSNGEFELILLDVGLPDLSGFDVCRKIREKSRIPIFFLTARASEIDKILGLELGADDYMTKPFSPRELTARIRAFFRRFQPSAPVGGSDPTSANSTNNSGVSKTGRFTILAERFAIQFEGRDLELRRYEFGILAHLLANPGRVYSRAQIMEAVWEDPDMSLERTIDTHIKVIRSKIAEYSPEEFIITHRGIGYSMKDAK